MKTRNTTPIIYIGNKIGLLENIVSALPVSNVTERRWIVPFCGSLSIPLHFRPKNAVYSDFCPELINFWKQIKRKHNDVVACYDKIVAGRETLSDKYYTQRNRINELIDRGDMTPERAAVFLFLNRFGFRGRWRVNRDGHANIPFDNTRKDTSGVDHALLRDVADYLGQKGIKIRCEPWNETLDRVDDDDFVLIDPPYHRVYDYSDRVKGTDPFGDEGQTALYRRVRMLRKQGIPFMLHNNPTEFILGLYAKIPGVDVVTFGRDHKVGYGKTLLPGATELIVTGGL